MLNVKHEFFKNSFFPSTTIEWNNLDPNIQNSESINIFKKHLLTFIRPLPNSVFNCHNARGVKLLTRLRLGLSHLREHKFKHSFQDSLSPLCDCRQGEVESCTHFLLHCSNFSNERQALLNSIKKVDSTILQRSDSDITRILLFGNESFDVNMNTAILNATIDFLITTTRFDDPLFNNIQLEQANFS